MAASDMTGREMAASDMAASDMAGSDMAGDMATTGSGFDGLASFLERAATRLLPAPPRQLPSGGFHLGQAVSMSGDHAASPGLIVDMPAGPGKPAAVLIPIIDHPGAPSVLLTRRSNALRNHSGQIAFPGGRIDAGDDGPLAAALREAREEIGLA